MAEEDEAPVEEAIGDDELTEGLEKKKMSGKLMVIIGGAAALLLIIVIVVVLLMGGEDEAPEEPLPEEEDLIQQPEEKPEEDMTPLQGAARFADPQEITLTLVDADGNSYYLRAVYVLEYDQQDYKDAGEAMAARVNNEVITHLRELRPEDLIGSAGPLLIQEELLIRINQAIAPARAARVLFQDGPNMVPN